MPPITADDYDENKKMSAPWYEKPLEGPTVGDKLIVFSYVPKGAPELVLQGPVFRYSDENRLLIIDQMAPPEREDWIQLPIIALILLIPLLSIFFYRCSKHNNLSDTKRKLFRKLALILPLLALGLYVYYESGISMYSNIRIDLLLIWPALAFNIVLFLIKKVNQNI